MRIRMIPSAWGGEPSLQYASSYVVDGVIAIDAGCLGMSGSPDRQAKIRHVFLTHSHIDHIASLPAFLENAFDPNLETVALYGPPEALNSLQQHVFNDVIWPDFVHICVDGRPFVRLRPLKEESPVQVGALEVTPVAVDHVVPTYGYIVTDGKSTVVFGGDSGPTDRIWELAAEAPRPLSVFLEACFPDEMSELAAISRHLTPALFAAEVKKIPDASPVIATHIKARFYDKVVTELRHLGISGLLIGEGEREYQL